MQYERMVSYIYGNGKNVGYVKIELRDNKYRLYLNVQADVNYPLGVYLYYSTGEKIERVFLGNAHIVHGYIEYKDVIWNENIDFDKYNGILLAKSSDANAEFMAQWKEEIVHPVQEKKDLLNDIIDNGEDILAFENDDYYPCVETTLEEIMECGKIPNAALSNSFLLHGYYRYKHLLIGRVTDKENTIFIGVPGTCIKREQMLAATFGFENFKRSQRSDIQCPHFGYWCIELIIE